MRNIFQTLLFRSLLFCSLAQTFSSHSGAESLEIEAGQGHISFIAIGKPAMLRIHGESNSMVAHLDLDKKQILTGEILALLNDFKTGIALRDEHMKKKYLETDQYPQAILKFQNLEIPKLKDGENRELKFKAGLTLHGVTRDTDIVATLTQKSNHFKVLSKLQIKLSDFKIDIPTYAGIKVADSVEIEVQFQTK